MSFYILPTFSLRQTIFYKTFILKILQAVKATVAVVDGPIMNVLFNCQRSTPLTKLFSSLLFSKNSRATSTRFLWERRLINFQ